MAILGVVFVEIVSGFPTIQVIHKMSVDVADSVWVVVVKQFPDLASNSLSGTRSFFNGFLIAVGGIFILGILFCSMISSQGFAGFWLWIVFSIFKFLYSFVTYRAGDLIPAIYFPLAYGFYWLFMECSPLTNRFTRIFPAEESPEFNA